MTFARILIATDFSDISLKAVQRGLQLAQEVGNDVILLHVVENTWYPSTFGMELVPPPPELGQEVRKAARDRLEKTKKDLAPAGLSCRTLLREGVPWSEIVDAGKAEKADLIVLGTHGYTGIKHALLGSQAERVVRHATCAVMTVPAAAK